MSVAAVENVSPLIVRNVQYQNSRNSSIAAGDKNPAIATYTTQLVHTICQIACVHTFRSFSHKSEN